MFALQLVTVAPFPGGLFGHRPHDQRRFCALLTLTNLQRYNFDQTTLGAAHGPGLCLSPRSGVQRELSRHSSLHPPNYVISQLDVNILETVQGPAGNTQIRRTQPLKTVGIIQH